MDLSFLEELEKEELRFKKFSLVGTGNVLASGSLKAGYAVNVDVRGDEAGADDGGTPVVQACCFNDGSCVEETAGECLLEGGTPQGSGTDCDPNPCPPPTSTGACCDNDCGCTETTAEECPGLWIPGGDCDPNPCPGGWYCSLYEHNVGNVGDATAFCSTDNTFWSHNNCFGGENVLEICTGTSTCYTAGPPECTITGTLAVQMDGSCDWTYVAEPEGCLCNCPQCVCECGPDDCCFFSDSVMDDCGDVGFIIHLHSGADCTNGTQDEFQIQIECHYPC